MNTIAIDKTLLNKKIDGELIYVYEDETLEDLLNTKKHCVRKDYINGVDINLTDYDIPCIAKLKYGVDDIKLPPKPDYKFGIIVPNCNNDHGNYKGKTFLRNCIESILNQTYENFELIIVDDCSTDSSVETVKSYKDKRIHLIENKRKRYNGGSRNVGIDYALTLDIDYICFLDSDDWWKHDQVLETINKNMYNQELMLIGLEMLFPGDRTQTKLHEYNNYEDFFLSNNKVWCTAWARVIRKDKITYFCEDTLMEDRVWSYRQADNVDLENVINLKEVMYVWNRLNTTNSVSMVRNGIWNASAYCHIGHQLQLIENLKHKEMIPILKERIEQCKKKANSGTYQQY